MMRMMMSVGVLSSSSALSSSSSSAAAAAAQRRRRRLVRVRKIVLPFALLALPVHVLFQQWNVMRSSLDSKDVGGRTSHGVHNSSSVTPAHDNLDAPQFPPPPPPPPAENDSPTFYLVAPPAYTTTTNSTLSWNDIEQASRYDYYRTHLNEESAEAWLHRGFAHHKRRIRHDPKDATVIVIAGYFHLHWGALTKRQKQREGGSAYRTRLSETYTRHLKELYDIDPDIKTRPHLVLIPTWNRDVSREIGVKALVKSVLNDALQVPNVWSVGFERNPFWQGVPVKRIVPIPYVVTLENNHSNELSTSSLIRDDDDEEEVGLPDGSSGQPTTTTTMRKSNFVFYAGDSRPNARLWAGCHRERLMAPLYNETNITDVRIFRKRRATTTTTPQRLNQTEYNYRMQTSEYCFILCGDTPTSRSLASAMVSGCIPIFIGSRWRGLCEPPCRKGWGWKSTGSDYPHLPYQHIIPWELFPELDEQRFLDRGKQELLDLLEQFTDERKNRLRSIMTSTRKGWIYGWGDPLTSNRFGDAVEYIWQSFLSSLPHSPIITK